MLQAARQVGVGDEDAAECDGIGMSARAAANGGLGLRIMRDRAMIIGATLTIEPAQPTGTLVTCSLVRTKNDPG